MASAPACPNPSQTIGSTQGDQRAASAPACPNPSQTIGLPWEIKGQQVCQPALIPPQKHDQVTCPCPGLNRGTWPKISINTPQSLMKLRTHCAMNNMASETKTVSWRCVIIFLAFNLAVPILGKHSNHLFSPGGPNSPDLKPKNGH